MKKQKNMGKRLSILAIVLAFVVVIMGLILFNQWLSNRNKTTMLASTEKIKTVKASEIFYDNYWSKSIITSVVDENVPIPEGMEYVSRNKRHRSYCKRQSNGKSNVMDTI